MQKTKWLSIISLVSASVSATAFADELTDTRWYVAPFASYINTGGDRNAKDGWGGGLGLGKMLDQHFNIELRGFYNGWGGKYGQTDLSGGTADVQYYFNRNKLSPYTVVAIGGVNTAVSGPMGGTQSGFIGEAGAGLAYEVLDNLSLRGDVRYRYNNNFGDHVQPGRTEFNDLVVNLGFVIPFGDKPKAHQAKFEIPAAAPKPVPNDCASRDSDHDGVNECLDKCPDTPKGSKVDVHGCPIRLILKGNHFKLDSAELTPEAKTRLNEVANSLNHYPEKNEIEVQGHTSSEGSDGYNLKLSQRRAHAVVEYLKSKGVSNKLTAKGYGESKPVADNRTEAGRSENRRVELIWITD